LFVTGDTGPMHIAAAVGTPSSHYSVADPLKTGPYTTVPLCSPSSYPARLALPNGARSAIARKVHDRYFGRRRFAAALGILQADTPARPKGFRHERYDTEAAYRFCSTSLVRRHPDKRHTRIETTRRPATSARVRLAMVLALAVGAFAYEGQLRRPIGPSAARSTMRIVASTVPYRSARPLEAGHI
jgi:hypothetical protein